MPKSLFENELMSEMEKELQKQASSKTPNLVQAAECLHAALEIFEQKGMQVRADQVLQILEKLAQSEKSKVIEKMPSLKALMESGLTQRDMHEFAKGSPVAKAKFNLVLRQLGLSDHQIGKFIGPTNVMSEEDAKQLIDPNRGFSKIWESIQDPFKQPADREEVKPGENLDFTSMASLKKKSNDLDGGDCAISIPPPFDKRNVTERDIDPDFYDLMDVFKSEDFDIDASDDELMGMEIKDDTLEVFEGDTMLEDFEDERRSN